MIVDHRWVRPVLLDTDSQYSHALPIKPDHPLVQFVFYTSVCNRDVMLSDSGADPGDELPRCPDCLSLLDDAAGRARLAAALPPPPEDRPDPALFVLVRPHKEAVAGNALRAPGEPVTHTAPILQFQRLQTEFSALCGYLFTWDDVKLINPSERATPCPECVLVWTLGRAFGGLDGGDTS